MPHIIIEEDGIQIFNWNKYKYEYVSLEKLEQYGATYLAKKVKQKKEKTLQQP